MSEKKPWEETWYFGRNGKPGSWPSEVYRKDDEGDLQICEVQPGAIEYPALIAAAPELFRIAADLLALIEASAGTKPTPDRAEAFRMRVIRMHGDVVAALRKARGGGT